VQAYYALLEALREFTEQVRVGVASLGINTVLPPE